MTQFSSIYRVFRDLRRIEDGGLGLQGTWAPTWQALPARVSRLPILDLAFPSLVLHKRQERAPVVGAARVDEPAAAVAVQRRKAVPARAVAVAICLLPGAQRREVALGARGVRGRAAVVDEQAHVLQHTLLGFRASPVCSHLPVVDGPRRWRAAAVDACADVTLRH